MEADLFQSIDQIIRKVLLAPFFSSSRTLADVFAIDRGAYHRSAVKEPEEDKSLRASQDNFVEKIIFNSAQFRRGIRDASLIIEMMEVGKGPGSDVV